MKEVEESWAYGVKTFVLFPKVPENLKTNDGKESFNPDGIVHRAVRMIKEKYPDSIVCTDVALDPYSDQGHDGIVKDGKILNDETIEQLCKQAVSQVSGCWSFHRLIDRAKQAMTSFFQMFVGLLGPCWFRCGGSQ